MKPMNSTGAGIAIASTEALVQLVTPDPRILGSPWLWALAASERP